MRQLDAIVFTEPASKRQTITLAATKSITHAGPNLVVSGTFVPAGTYVDVTVQGRGELYGWGWAQWEVLYGIADGNGRLRTSGQYSPLIAGANIVYLGAGGSFGPPSINTPAFDTFRISGLTPGTTYTIMLEMGIIGGSDSVFGELAIGQVNRSVWLPNGEKIYTANKGGDQVHIIDGPWTAPLVQQVNRQVPRNLAEAFRRNLATCTWPSHIDASPDSSRVAVVEYYGDLTVGPRVLIIETTGDSVERTIQPAGTGTYGVNVMSGVVWVDNTSIYVSGGLTGRVYKVNALTGATQATINLAGTANVQNDMCVSRSHTRTVGVTSGSSTVTDAAITAADVGRPVTSSGYIPASTYVGTVTAGVSFLLSSSPTSQVGVNALGTGSVSATFGVNYVYGAGSEGQKLYRIKVNDATFTTTTLSSASVPLAIAVGYDDRIYLGLTSGNIEVRNADLTLYETISPPTPAVGSAIYDMKFSTDGEFGFVAWANGTFGFLILSPTMVPHANWHDMPQFAGCSVSGIALSPEESIFATVDSGVKATSYAYIWPGALMMIRTAGIEGFYQEGASIFIDGVA